MYATSGLDARTATIAVFSASSSASPTVAELRKVVAGRIHRFSRYRQGVRYLPFPLVNPVWVDDPEFDLLRHVRRHEQDDIVSTDALPGIMVERLEDPYDLSHPPWRITMVEEVEGARFAIVFEAHHCLGYGPATTAFLAGLVLGFQPTDGTDEPQPWAARPVNDSEILRRSLTDRFEKYRSELELGDGAVARRARNWMAPRLHSLVDAIPAGLTEKSDERIAPALPDHRPSIEVAFWRGSLTGIKVACRQLNATVNDLMVTAYAGGVAAWAKANGRVPGDPPLGVALDTGVDQIDPGHPGNSSLDMIVTGLAANVSDSLERLRLITMRVRSGLRNFEQRGSHEEKYDFVLSNFPGSPINFWFQSHPMEYGGSSSNVGVGREAAKVTITSVVDSVSAVFLNDVSRVGCPEVFVAGFSETIADLLEYGHRVALLTRQPLLATVKDADLDRLARGMVPVEVHTGDVVLAEGKMDSDPSAYLVEQGKLGVSIKGRSIGMLESPELFGEVGLLEHARTATVTAQEPSKLYEIDGRTLKSILTIDVPAQTISKMVIEEYE
jgi:hypothetical protein